MRKALDDIVILDFSRYIAGPYAAYLLGHMGAYVIKVEKSYVGEDMRQYPPFFNGESLAYPSYASNKHSLCMNLRDDRAKQIITELIPHTDILIQNFRAGTIEKMGFDWETLHKLNPRLIMANNSGYGQYGPYSKRVAFDSIIQSESGLINSVCEESGGMPFYPGGNNSDHIGALCLVSAIMAALAERDRTGEGKYLEVDMMSAVSAMFSPELSLHEAAGAPVKIHDFAPLSFYKDVEGRVIQISCPDRYWAEFRAIVGDSALNDEKFSTLEGRRANKTELDAIVEKWTSVRTAGDICARLEAGNIGAAAVQDYKDILSNEHAEATGALRSLDVPYVGPAPYPDVPFRLSASPIEYDKISKIGEDNYEVLHKFLNKSREEVSELLEAGVLYQSEHSVWK